MVFRKTRLPSRRRVKSDELSEKSKKKKNVLTFFPHSLKLDKTERQEEIGVPVLGAARLACSLSPPSHPLLTMGSSGEVVWARLSDASSTTTTTAADEHSSSSHSAAVSLWRDLAGALSADPGA